MVRNIANIVPPYETTSKCAGVGAALEFGVLSLRVETILVMGHSCCAGIKRLMLMPDHDFTLSIKDSVEDWIKICLPAKAKVKDKCTGLNFAKQCAELEREALKLSLGNLLTYPFVKKAVANQNLALKGGYYDFVKGSFELWDLQFSLFPSITYTVSTSKFT
ncbi:hypothetical protein ACH5RR_003851 [Cinchona calisaya]|uniref:Carbonic anhydrase n=1 Tax=Cinchona calisaya TaxID=153742 RepID=A0ABD3AVW4_9GENT